MLAEVGNVFTQIIAWIGEFLTALTATDGALVPLLGLFALGIGIALARAIVSLIRNVTWGA